MDNRRIFAFLADQLKAGRRCVLTTITSVTGSSMRSVGAHMGICEDGNFIGSLSGGCIENSVVTEALQTLETGQPRITRFGTGSPYIDIKLPCGGGLDVHFLPLCDEQLVKLCRQAIERRRPFSIQLPIENGPMKNDNACFLPEWQATEYDEANQNIVIGHHPHPRLLIIGHGAGVESLAELASAIDIESRVITPDERLLSTLDTKGIKAVRIRTTNETSLVSSDAWTAIVFLFHDHDWETELMAHAFKQPHFYLGAMGGRIAHALRGERLLEAGSKQSDVDSIHAPVGLFHSSRDPDTLAISTLAEILKAYQETDFASINE